MSKKLAILFFILNYTITSYGQGYNHQWLLGNYYFPQDPKGRMFIDSSNYNVVTEFRKMPFLGTQGNISDANGNFLMSSNGVWIANANNDTMMNGSGLNPNGITSSWPFGLPLTSNNIFLPMPGDSNNYLLIHHTATQFSGSFIPALELFYSKIDITQNGGLGNVVSKNNVIFQDTLNWGIGACRHSNGQDWWVVMMKDSSDIVYTVLIDSSNNFTVTSQSLGYLPLPHAAISQLIFSSDGTKFISSTYDNYIDQNSYLILADFNRCTGLFSNVQSFQLSIANYINGMAFSPSGEFAYVCTSNEIFQVNTSTLAIDTVAIYDGFISPPTSPCCPSTFFNMYLAANGKIYITSGSSVRHFTEINYPDSAGLACDVQQHAVFIGNYAHLRAVPNHPNYYLGCDTTLGCPCFITGVNDLLPADFKFRIYPNPVSNGIINIGYLLPQNKSGLFQIFDVAGKIVFQITLPPWSNEQSLILPQLSGGIYNGVIRSGSASVNKKIAVISDK